MRPRRGAAGTCPGPHRITAPGAVVVPGDHALEVGILDGVILDVHGQTLLVGADRRTLGNGPTLQDAAHLQPQVIVHGPGGVLLHHEQASGRGDLAPECFRSTLRIALAAVFIQRRGHNDLLTTS